MGGNVFPGKNRRYSKQEYLDLVEEIKPLLDKISVCYELQHPLSEKDSFGDLDLVVIPSIELSVPLLKDIFNTEYVNHNGTIWSLIYRDFQVDLITSSPQEFQFAKNYFCLPADRANFVGKIAHQLGLKFGHDGLWLPIRLSNSHKLGDILLTLNPYRAEEFIDIKPLTKSDTFQDIFDNISASKYFNPSIFALENNNAIARVRDKKRPYYHKFLELCSVLPEKDWFVKSKNKDEYLPMIFDEFAHAHKEYRIIMVRKEKLDLVREKFNGNLVQEWTGLDGKDLGELMIKLKGKLSDDDILCFDSEKLKQIVIDSML